MSILRHPAYSTMVNVKSVSEMEVYLGFLLAYETQQRQQSLIDVTSFLLGLLMGITVLYFFLMGSMNKERPNIAAHIEKQQSEKQKRKKKILRIMWEKGSVKLH